MTVGRITVILQLMSLRFQVQVICPSPIVRSDAGPTFHSTEAQPFLCVVVSRCLKVMLSAPPLALKQGLRVSGPYSFASGTLNINEEAVRWIASLPFLRTQSLIRCCSLHVLDITGCRGERFCHL